MAGFTINEAAGAARARLGLPLIVDTLGPGPDPALSLTNAERGITLIVTESEGVSMIIVTHRDAGALDGIRVGDTRTQAIARWGKPAGASSGNALWAVGRWIIQTKLDSADRIVRLTVGK